MSMSMIILIIVIVLGAILTFIGHKNDSVAALEQELRTNILMLFTFAEKQDLISADKMKLVIDIVYKKFPVLIQAVLKETTVETYVQDLYDEFKQYLVDGNIADFVVIHGETPVVNPTPAPSDVNVVVTPVEPTSDSEQK